MAYRPPCPAIFCLSAALMISHHTGVLAQGRVDFEGGGPGPGPQQQCDNRPATAPRRFARRGEKRRTPDTRGRTASRACARALKSTKFHGHRPPWSSSVASPCDRVNRLPLSPFFLFRRLCLARSVSFPPAPDGGRGRLSSVQAVQLRWGPHWGARPEGDGVDVGLQNKGGMEGIPRSSLSSPCPLSDRS